MVFADAASTTPEMPGPAGRVQALAASVEQAVIGGMGLPTSSSLIVVVDRKPTSERT